MTGISAVSAHRAEEPTMRQRRQSVARISAPVGAVLCAILFLPMVEADVAS